MRVNLEIGRFLGAPTPSRRVFRRAKARRKPRALFISSPIGLGHVQRDLAIARELRRLAGELQIDWLAQHPVTRVLEDAGETMHRSAVRSPASPTTSSAQRASTSCTRSGLPRSGRDLPGELHGLSGGGARRAYDLWIGDEAWEVDYWLHENPELKTAPFAFLTDFVGFLPVDRRPCSDETRLSSNYNAEMIEQVERFPRVRDQAIYLGDPGDLLPEWFGPGLPPIRDRTLEHFTTTGYAAPFDPAGYTDLRAVRQRLGYDPERPLVICAVGGTGIGRHLLRKTIDAWPLIRAQRPDACCVAVAGPRIDPASLPQHPGLEVRGYVQDLYQHLAVADLAVLQGGLATTMELAITRRPFLYFPLAAHFEQLYHVAHRLDAHRAGRRLAYQDTNAGALADAALQTLGTDTSAYRQHRLGAARRTASLIAGLL